MRQLYLQKGMVNFVSAKTIVDRNKEKNYVISSVTNNNNQELCVHDNQNNKIASVEIKENLGNREGMLVVENQNLFLLEQVVTTLSLQEQTDLYLVGDWKELSFDLMKGYRKLGKVRPKWMAFGSSSCEITVFEEQYETILVSTVSAIDYFNAKKESEDSQKVLQII